MRTSRRTRRRPAILVIAAGCVLAGALATAGPAGAASRQWTVVNRNHFVSLELVSVKPWEDNPSGFEGHPADGSEINADGRQHFELKYGSNYQAVLKYRIRASFLRDRRDDYVEYWINNRLDFLAASCRFIDGDKTTDWSSESHHEFGGNGPFKGYSAWCVTDSAYGIGPRFVWLSDHPADVKPPE